jgi:hypothetical protein
MAKELRERDDLLERGMKRLVKVVLPKQARLRKKRHPRWRQWKKAGDELPVFYPSEADACRRQLCYWLLGYDPMPETPESAMRLYDGDYHGESIIYWLRKMGFEVDGVEGRMKKKFRLGDVEFILSGRRDAMLRVDGAVMVLENKGLSTHTLRRHELDIVNAGYRRQGQLYMHVLKEKMCLFAIKDKNNSKIRMWDLGYDKRVVRMVLKRWKQVVVAVKKKKILDRDHEKGSLKCDWCRFNKECWGDRS